MKSSVTVNALKVVAALTMLALFAGCTPKSSLDLKYQPFYMGAKTCSKSVALIKFDDKRDRQELGNKQNEVFFYPAVGQDVSLWVTKAFQTELESAGCKVEYAEKMYDFKSKYVITGVIRNIYLNQNSATNYKVAFKMNIKITKGEGNTFEKDYVANWENTELSINSKAEELLRNGLQDVMKAAVPDFLDQIK